MSQSNYREEKALQALYYLQSKTHITDKMSLVKLLFFADRFHIRNFCVPMLCDSYTAMRQGPVCSKTYDLIKKGQYFDYLPLAKQKFVAKNLSCKKKTIVTVADTGDDELSKSDKAALDFSIKNFAHFGRRELSKISHAYPEWNKFKIVLETEFSNAEEMSYTDFFDDPAPNDVYIKKYLNGKDPFGGSKESLYALKQEYQMLVDSVPKKRSENVAKIRRFAEYKKNWNGYNAEPIDKKIIDRALHFLYRATVQPKVFLTARSTVQFEWDGIENKYLEVEIFNDHYAVYSENNGNESELEVEELSDCMEEIERYYA